MLSQTFSALADPTRREILELLKKQDFSAGDLGKNFSITAPSLSHHLNALKQAGLVSSRRQGQEIIYSLNLSAFEELTEIIISFFKINR
ncbi:winged helix-turn-helix transcriptional regulator [Candidatus Falkowbacteria bacterium]|nr:winged helix-turn-helix transcriptional regulator [Candidatus Falkowbacteria bacterium]